jgi:hypothetical protein
MQKTWGPFTGRQLTVIAVTLIVCILVPGTVWAVDQFTNVAIQDPVTGTKATVGPAHRLLVGDGGGPLTVDGNVSEAAPANFVRFSGPAAGSCSDAYTVPAGQALILKSMQAFLHSTGGAGTSIEVDVYSQSGCGGSLVAAAVGDRAHETVAQNFEPGIAIPAGRTVSTIGFGNSGIVLLEGYLVPASSVPAGAAPTEPAVPGQSPTHAPKK